MNIGLSSAMPFGSGSPQAALGIMYLGAVLRDNGYKVTLYDTQYLRNLEEFRNEIMQLKPNVMGFTVRTTELKNALELARIVREVNSGCIVIFGGPHPTVWPKEVLQNPEVDIVVYGEGEHTLLELVQAVDRGKSIEGIQGVIFKANGELITNPTRLPIEDLDSIPFPARELVKGFRENFKRVPPFPWIQPATNAICSRGCPFNCSFCQPMLRMLFGKKVRRRSVDNVMQEIRQLKEEYGIRTIHFQDDTFTVDKKWTLELCKRIQNSGLGVNISVLTRVNVFDREIAHALKGANCIRVALGVESGSTEIREGVLRKGISNIEIRNAFKYCAEAGIVSFAALMIGSPGDTRQTIEETIDLVSEISPDLIDTHYTTPLPGSDLFDIALKQGTLLQVNGDRYDGSNKVIELENLEPEELVALHDLLELKWRQNYRILKRGFYIKAWMRWIWNMFQLTKDPRKITIHLVINLLCSTSYIAYRLITPLLKFGQWSVRRWPGLHRFIGV